MNTQLRTTVIALTVTFAAAFLPGAVYAAETGTPSPLPATNKVAMSSSQGNITLDKAAETALKRVGGGVVEHVCLDREHGVSVYHVRIYHSGHRVDYYLDRDTFETVKHKEKQYKKSDSFQRRKMDVTPTITFDKAAEMVIAHTGGGTLKEVSRDAVRGDNGSVPAYKVEIIVHGEKRYFYVDIHSGAILKHHKK